MPSDIPSPLGPILAVTELLELAARELAQEANKRVEARRPRKKRGSTLRPGKDTLLWNALIAVIKPSLKRRGARALLARELGVHRARIGEYFDKQSAMPDAERTLRLLALLGRLANQEKNKPETARE